MKRLLVVNICFIFISCSFNSKNNSNGKKIDVEQIIQKRPLIKYLEKGIENLENIDWY